MGEDSSFGLRMTPRKAKELRREPDAEKGSVGKPPGALLRGVGAGAGKAKQKPRPKAGLAFQMERVPTRWS